MVIFTPPPPLKKWILCQATLFHIGAMKRSRKVANSNPLVRLDGDFLKCKAKAKVEAEIYL